jgi:AraC-like DNA-binding protein
VTFRLFVLRVKASQLKSEAAASDYSEEARSILSRKLEVFRHAFTPGMPFWVARCEPQRPREPHSHEYHEIVIVTRGSGMHVSKYHAWPIQTGDVFVIGGSQGHYYDNVQDLHLVNVLFQRRLVQLDAHGIGELSGFQAMFGVHPPGASRDFRSRFRLKPADFSELLVYVDRLEKEILSSQPGQKCAAHAYFMLIIVFLSRLYSMQNIFDSAAVFRLAKVISFIEANFLEGHRVKELAATAGMSERVFLDAFRNATGFSPYSYLLELRIRRAAEALRDSEKQITEVAFSCGFNDSNYFTRQFKKRMGLTPLDYRRKILRTGHAMDEGVTRSKA